MRTLLKAHLDVAAANKAAQEGRIGQVIGAVAEMIKPEASYFLTENGKRTAYFVFDLHDPSQIPQIAEPFFIELNAEVHFAPVMNQEELGRGLQAHAQQAEG